MKTFRLSVILIAMMLFTQQTWAHPMGNFSINTYSLLTVSRESLNVRYIVDRAEMPAFQNGENIDINEDGLFSDAERENYAKTVIPMLTNQLVVKQDGQPLLLTVTDWTLTFPQGQGDLLTEKIAIEMSASLVGDYGEIMFEDNNFLDRIGWREIVVNAADGIAVTGAVRAADLSTQLTDFPDDLVSPPTERFAQFKFESSSGTGKIIQIGEIPVETHEHENNTHTHDHHHDHHKADFHSFWQVTFALSIVAILFVKLIRNGKAT